MFIRLLFVLLFSSVLCISQNIDTSLNIIPVSGYPRWLESGKNFTQQTSGMTFLLSDEKGRQHFLLADDIGALHHLVISEDTLLSISPVHLSPEVLEYLTPFPKKDFEELLYDRHSGKVYLSIEGNGPKTKSLTGIYQLTFYQDDIFTDSVTAIKKIIIEPQDEFLKHAADNIGFEGIASDESYFYLALEGFSVKGLFADSTLLYIVDREDFTIKKIISTKKAGIHTICGLYSDKNYSLYGVDRNNKTLFHLEIDKDLNIKTLSLRNIPTAIPNYKSFDYVVSFESLTMDDSHNLYLVDDPWRSYYIPSDRVLLQLDEKTIRNFKAFIPAIYKFSLVY